MYAALPVVKMASTCVGGQRMVSEFSVVPVKSAVDPGIISRPRSCPWVRIWSRNTIWSGKMLAGSPRSSLRWRNSGSKKHGGPADGTTQVAPTWAMYWRARSICRCRFWVPNASLARAGMS